MGQCQFYKNSPPHGPVRVRTRVVGRLGSGMRVSASFQIIPRLLVGQGQHQGQGQDSTSWIGQGQECGLVVAEGEKCPTSCKTGGGIFREGGMSKENVLHSQNPSQVVTPFCCCRPEPLRFFEKLALIRTPNPIRPMRQGPDPNRPMYGSIDGSYGLEGLSWVGQLSSPLVCSSCSVVQQYWQQFVCHVN